MARSTRRRAVWLVLALLPAVAACQLSEIKVGSDGSSVTMSGASDEAPTTPGAAAYTACRTLLETQAAAWNRGDIEAFAAGYDRTEHLVFATTDATHVGFDDMLARYRKTYPDRAAMGQLDFSELDFADLGAGHVVARGRWQLQRADDAPRGTFMLIFRERPQGWRIVLDYTTSEGT